VGFDVTRPLFLGAGVVALVIIVAIWRFFPPPLPPRRARLSLGLRALIVVLLTASLAGFEDADPGAAGRCAGADRQ
jgi:hypothetical protein